MVTKRVSTGKKPTKRKAAASSAADLTDGAAMSVLESGRSDTSPSTPLDPEARRQKVAAEAYFLAERRGFAAGHELEDWVAAEAVVDSRLRTDHAA